jgi:hypothetical protein
MDKEFVIFASELVAAANFYTSFATFGLRKKLQ